jgi:Kef-type K+ transport system membrane component KefB
MSEGTSGLLILAGIAMSSAVLWHWLVPRYIAAVVGATITAAAAFQYVAYLHLGYFDPFFLVAIITSSVMAAVIALLVGLPFRAVRRSYGADS